MNIHEIKNLNLSESDFRMINDALENLPNKDSAGDLMIGLLGAAFMKDDPLEKEKFLNQQKLDAIKKKKEREFLIEEVRILQGKILMLQRQLRMSGLLDDANIIIRPI